MYAEILQKLELFSQSLLAPLSYLTAAGLFLVAGALLTSAPLRQLCPVLNWLPIRLTGQVLYNGMMVLINDLSVLLCVGIAAVRTRSERQEAALLALMAYLIFLTVNHTALDMLGQLAEADGLTGLAATGQTTILGIQVMDTGVAGGILLGFVVARIFDRTCEKRFSGMIAQLYSGLRWSFLCIAAFAVVFGLGVCFVWPPLQAGIRSVTGWIAASGNAGVFLYGFLERLLIPTGLHHLIYMPFQFSALGGSLTVGSITYTGAYAVTMAEYSYGLPLTDNMIWMYTGFTKTFGYLGIAAAFVFTAKKRTAAGRLPRSFRWQLRHRWHPSRNPWTSCSASSRRCCGSSMRPSRAVSWSCSRSCTSMRSHPTCWVRWCSTSARAQSRPAIRCCICWALQKFWSISSCFRSLSG